MKRTQFSGAFVICEGSTDSRLLRRFVDESACQLVVAHEKATALDAIGILDNNLVRGCVAIIDADFDRQNGVSYGSSNVIATPAHDLDVMLFMSPALDKVLDEYGSADKLRAFEERVERPIRETILEAAAAVGALRLASYRRSLSLDFEALKFTDFLDRDALTVDRSLLLRAARNASQRHDLAESQLSEWCDEIVAQSYPVTDLCNGHDLVQVTSIALRKAIGSASPSMVVGPFLEAQLRIGYEKSWFWRDPLFDALTAWERLNHPHTVLLR